MAPNATAAENATTNATGLVWAVGNGAEAVVHAPEVVATAAEAGGNATEVVGNETAEGNATSSAGSSGTEGPLVGGSGTVGSMYAPIPYVMDYYQYCADPSKSNAPECLRYW